VQLYCVPVGYGGDVGLTDLAGLRGYKHCFVRVKCECQNQSYDLLLEVTEQDDKTGLAVIPQNPPTFSTSHGGSRVALLPADNDSRNCQMEDCILSEYHRRRKAGQPYGPGFSGYLYGPNSNTFANDILTKCGVAYISWPTGVTPYTRSE
jgi:hypothetical protein